MSDQGKWWKLWVASLSDDELENLSIHEWFGWARFGAHMKAHGKDGKIRLRAPATAVVNLLRVPSFTDAIDMIKRWPNYTVEGLERGSEEGEKGRIFVTPNVTDTVSVKCQNWNKFQGDWSRDRVRKHRKAVTPNVTAQEEKRSRREVEEKRSLTPTPKPPQAGAPNSKILEWFETTWKAYPKERRSGKKAALRSYQKAVKDVETARDVAAALDAYLASKTVQDGFVKNASTWFANWEDYKDDQRRNSQSLHREDIERCADPRTAGAGVQAAAANSLLHQLANSKAFPK